MHPQANCFVFYFRLEWFTNAASLVTAMEALSGPISDACTTYPFPSERGVLSCIYGLSQAFYTPFEVSLHLREGSVASDAEIAAACSSSMVTYNKQYCSVVQREITLVAPSRELPNTVALWCDRFAGDSNRSAVATSAQHRLAGLWAQRWKACIVGTLHRTGIVGLI
jgi:hypothetical protein